VIPVGSGRSITVELQYEPLGGAPGAVLAKLFGKRSQAIQSRDGNGRDSDHEGDNHEDDRIALPIPTKEDILMKSAGSAARTLMARFRGSVNKGGSAPFRSATRRSKGRTIFLPTPREREVLRLVWTGLSNREIADRLGISSRTIEAHRASLMKKLRVTNTAQLVRIAIEQGLIRVG
jgi:DNA-binding CsgD family transcriptional regulator